jgi:2-amino-4-hydroxy-6-hydroxymethyldihydropteridine diphosphokinase
MMYDVFIGLGSNLGERLEMLQRAIQEIGKISKIEAASSVYETEPSGMNSTHQFLNMAVKIRTEVEPPHLLHKLKAIEKKLGRTPSTHLKDREIDIDILLYDGLYFEDHELHVPHLALAQRRFALTTLNDIAPMVKHPLAGTTIKTLLKHCPDTSGASKLDHHP